MMLCAALAVSATAQNLNAYSDYRGYFFVFDSGTLQQLEHQPVRSFKTSVTYVAYEDNSGVLKVYYNGSKIVLDRGFNGTYDVTDYLVVYNTGGVLRAFDRGKSYDLTYRTGTYLASDNLVAFRDANYLLLKVYSEGEQLELENLTLGEVQQFKAGDNTLAFVTYNSRFRIYYEGQMHDVDEFPPVSFACGKDVVAYVDASNGMFKGFINGKSYKLDEFEPLSYKVADSLIAFVSRDGNFKIVTGKTVKDVEPYTPDLYVADDRVVIYARNNFFYAFVNGTSYELEPFIPVSYKTDGDKIAWLDQGNKIKWLNKGEVEVVTYEGSKDFELTGNTIRFKDNSGQTRIYWNKKIY